MKTAIILNYQRGISARKKQRDTQERKREREKSHIYIYFSRFAGNNNNNKKNENDNNKPVLWILNCLASFFSITGPNNTKFDLFKKLLRIELNVNLTEIIRA